MNSTYTPLQSLRLPQPANQSASTVHRKAMSYEKACSLLLKIFVAGSVLGFLACLSVVGVPIVMPFLSTCWPFIGTTVLFFVLVLVGAVTLGSGEISLGVR